jgi:hypothetical protein
MQMSENVIILNPSQSADESPALAAFYARQAAREAAAQSALNRAAPLTSPGPFRQPRPVTPAEAKAHSPTPFNTAKFVPDIARTAEAAQKLEITANLGIYSSKTSPVHVKSKTSRSATLAESMGDNVTISTELPAIVREKFKEAEPGAAMTRVALATSFMLEIVAKLPKNSIWSEANAKAVATAHGMNAPNASALVKTMVAAGLLKREKNMVSYRLAVSPTVAFRGSVHNFEALKAEYDALPTGIEDAPARGRKPKVGVE